MQPVALGRLATDPSRGRGPGAPAGRRPPAPASAHSAASLALGLALAAAPAFAQVFFGAPNTGPGGPGSGLFVVGNGTVAAIATGLPDSQFPALSPNGQLLTLASRDPLQPGEASTDLFAHRLVGGSTQRLVNHSTFAYPNGYTRFASPQFSAISAGNGLVAYTTQVAATGSRPNQGLPADPYPFGRDVFRMLSVVRADTGALVSRAELGIGDALDLFNSEYFGISWWPFGPVFATSAYVPVVSNLGRETFAAGIVVFGPDAAGQFVRIGQYTQPEVIDQPGVRIIVRNHALPVFSPDGRRLAFFRLTWPNVTMQEPASAELMVLNTQVAEPPSVLLGFQPGLFPTGLSWSMDGSQLVFAVAQQQQSGGVFLAAADPASSVLRSVSAAGGPPAPIPGAPAGYFPNAMPALLFRGGFEN
jgi:hypothetical protein